MTKKKIRHLIDQYWRWLDEKTSVTEGGNYTVITTPYLDNKNDYIEVVAEEEGGEIHLTDDGFTVFDLKSSGVDLSTEKRQKMLQKSLNRFGVEFKHPEIFTSATPENFSHRLHRLLQAILSIGDLHYTSRQNVVSLFLEEVEHWLEEIGVRAVPDNNFTGRSGFTHHFDFVIPRSESSPERVIEAVNRPDRGNVERLIMAWEDTQENRRHESIMYAVLNDSEKAPSTPSMQAMKSYGVRPVRWSERADFAEELAA